MVQILLENMKPTQITTFKAYETFSFWFNDMKSNILKLWALHMIRLFAQIQENRKCVYRISYVIYVWRCLRKHSFAQIIVSCVAPITWNWCKRTYRCGSIPRVPGGEVLLMLDGGDVLLLYRFHNVRRDISSALKAASRGDTVSGGDWEPRNIFSLM